MGTNSLVGILWQKNENRVVYSNNHPAVKEVRCILREQSTIPYDLHFLFLALTDITFDLAQPIPKRFELSFKKENTWYAVNGSEYELIASEVCCVWTS